MQQQESVEEIVIAGAGLAGLATALGLHRKGVRSLVLESSPKLRATGFALGTWTNGFRALDALGVGDKIREHHLLLERFVVFSASTGDKASELSLRAPAGKCGLLEMRRVKRNFLLETLEKELPTSTIRYSSKIVSIEKDGNVKILHLSDGSILRAKVLIGCDGVNSIVAKWLGLAKPSFSGRFATRGMAEYMDGHSLEPVSMMFIGKGFRMGVVPCNGTSVYWFYTWYPSANDKDAEESTAKMRQYVLTNLRNMKVPEKVMEIIQRSEMSEVASCPLRIRSPLSLLWGSISKQNVCVAGDALHPMTPDLAQGGCSALEDGVILARCLSEAIHSDDKKDDEYKRFKKALDKYTKIRRWRSIHLITIAYLVGFIQQSKNAFIRFLREKLLLGILAKMVLKMTEYDCGEL